MKRAEQTRKLELQEFQRESKQIASDNAIVRAIAMESTAAKTCERLHSIMERFDERLDDTEEVGVRLVSFGQEIVFHVQSVGFWNPHLIIFEGVKEDGSLISLVQHTSQLSFLLTALKRLAPEEPKRPIGFGAMFAEEGESEAGEEPDKPAPR